MKKIILTSFLLLLFFVGCGQSDKLAFYKQDANSSNYPHAWQELLLLPDEYLPQASLKHFKHPPYISEYQENNPGFIDLKKFRHDFPKHELSNLLLWYSASFFYPHQITHYMIMEFQTQELAKSYVARLKTEDRTKVNKILRFKSILFSFTLRDFNNKFLNKNNDDKSQRWIKETIERIGENI